MDNDLYFYTGLFYYLYNMKAKVTTAFTCRISRKHYRPGDIYEGTMQRIEELVSKGKVKIEAEKTEQVPTPKAEQSHVPKAEKPKRNVKK